MECSKPGGCPEPLECSGNGCCGAGDSFDCCSSTLGNPESVVAETHIFGEPLDLRVNRLEAQVVELLELIDRLDAR